MPALQTERFAQAAFASVAALWDWLAAHHGQDASIWAVTFKKHVPDKYVSRFDVLDALVAYGWIDGIRRKVDADRTMQMISPRKQQAWAQSYKDRAATLIADGRMQPPGLASIAAGRASGLWDAMAAVDALHVPDDLHAALGTGDAWFTAAAPSYRRNVLRWIEGAKTPVTRAKRIGIVAEHARAGTKVPNY